MAVESDVRIVVNGRDVFEAKAWEIESNIMQPADAFSIHIANPGGVNKGKISKFDSVQVLLDETVQMSGYVDDVNSRSDAAGGGAIEIIGRDRFGQLIDCSADSASLLNLDLWQIAKKVAAPFVTNWLVDNETNRQKLLALRRKYRRAHYEAHRYAVRLADMSLLDLSVPTQASPADKKRLALMKSNITKLKALVFPRIKIQPGESKLEVIERAAAKTEMMVWLAADGSGVIARPNYDQQPMFSIRHYPLDSQLSPSNNVKSAAHTDSGRDIFATYKLGGSAANTSSTNAAASKFNESATDSNVTLARKKIINGSGQNRKQARKELDRDVQIRQFNETVLTFIVQGHTQNDRIWQVDTMVSVEDQINGYSGPYYLTRRTFRGSKEGGQTTEIELHPPRVLLP